MKYISVCSGIEAATQAWAPLGWEAVCFSEIEPFPCAVLAHHYPDVPNVGDMMTFDWKQYSGKADVVIGGTPCQSFSIAGLRGGLDDDRGNLTLKFVEVCNDVRPDFIVWENVPGVLSDKTNAFGCLLAGLVGSDTPLVSPLERGRWTDSGMVAGPTRTAAWRVLNAQFFGLAQRRRRVFVISCPRNGANPSEILFELKDLPGNIAKIRARTLFCCDTGLRTYGRSSKNNVLIDIEADTARLLTPLEEERAFGFQDNYTNIPYGRPRYPDQICPDGHRYRSLGNSMARSVMEWIGRRIAA